MIVDTMKKTKFIFGLLFVLLTISSVIYLYFNYNLELTGSRNQSLENRDQELGEISMADGVKEISFIYKNTSGKDINLNELYTSCMCTKAKIIVGENQSGFAGMKGHKSGLKPINPNMTLKPGEVAQLAVEYDPNAHGPDGVGPMTRTVYLGTDSQEQQIKFNFSGVVIK